MLIESLGVFVHFGNALWNPYRLTNGQKINVFQIMNGVLALSALIALIVGGILLFAYPNSGAEMVVVFAFVAVFFASAADYLIDPISAAAKRRTDSEESPEN